MYDSASGHVTVTSQHNDLPLCQGTRVTPSSLYYYYHHNYYYLFQVLLDSLHPRSTWCQLEHMIQPECMICDMFYSRLLIVVCLELICLMLLLQMQLWRNWIIFVEKGDYVNMNVWNLTEWEWHCDVVIPFIIARKLAHGQWKVIIGNH